MLDRAVLEQFAQRAVLDVRRAAQDEKAATVTGFVERALDWFALHGITARRLMTDNAFSLGEAGMVVDDRVGEVGADARLGRHPIEGGALPPDEL